MNARHLPVSAETHFNDLQADMEAGSRLINHVHHKGLQLRRICATKRSDCAALIDALLNQVVELKACVIQQRKTMRELRHDIRGWRQAVKTH